MLQSASQPYLLKNRAGAIPVKQTRSRGERKKEGNKRFFQPWENASIRNKCVKKEIRRQAAQVPRKRQKSTPGEDRERKTTA